MFSPRGAGAGGDVTALSQNEGKRVDSIYKNIMQSEIQREKSVMEGCIDTIKNAKAK
jgi:hypothetical protein